MVQKLDTLHDSNPKAFWQIINKLKGKTPNPNPINLSEWHDYMEKLYSEDSSNDSDSDIFINNDNPSESGPLDFPFTCSEVRKAILKLKNNKQPGIDLLPNEFIKYIHYFLL